MQFVKKNITHKMARENSAPINFSVKNYLQPIHKALSMQKFGSVHEIIISEIEISCLKQMSRITCACLIYSTYLCS